MTQTSHPLDGYLDGKKHKRSPEREHLYRKLVPRMKKAGFRSLNSMGMFIGVTAKDINNFFLHKQYELPENGSWHEISTKIAGALNTTPETLFGLPENICTDLAYVQIEILKGTATPDSAGAIISVPTAPTQLESAEQQALNNILKKLLLSLSPREERVIRLRFGIDGQEAKTLEEIGDLFNLARSRIGQIENKAMAKLQRKARQQCINAPIFNFV